MTKPYVISINAVSGGGKTTVAELVRQSLSAVLFCFDDFDDTNIHPDDLYEWTKRGANLLEYDCPGMSQAVHRELQRTGIEYIVLDYPFGRDHPRFREIIDLAVFIDTPLDVAMARRILRDYTPDSTASGDSGLTKLRDEIAHYLEKAGIHTSMFNVLADEALYQFVGGSPPRDVESLARQYEFWEGRVSPDGSELWLNWVLRLRVEGELIGHFQAGVTPESADIAWFLGLRWQHQGYATEAGTAVVDWLREVGVHEIRASINPAHAASIGVAERLGLRRTDEMSGNELIWKLALF